MVWVEWDVPDSAVLRTAAATTGFHGMADRKPGPAAVAQHLGTLPA
jgi:hypothetical protein